MGLILKKSAKHEVKAPSVPPLVPPQAGGESLLINWEVTIWGLVARFLNMNRAIYVDVRIN